MIIKQNLDLRPCREHKTHCLYIHGPTGIGKTKYTHALLRTIQKHYPEIDYYMKSYGFTSEYWDGYSDQVAVVVDDPSKPLPYKSDQISECWKNILRGAQFIANQKYGGIQFDSHLCVILSNIAAKV